MLAHLHPVKINPERVSKNQDYENELNIKGISWPMKDNKIRRFEEKNNLKLNVFKCEKDGSDLRLVEITGHKADELATSWLEGFTYECEGNKNQHTDAEQLTCRQTEERGAGRRWLGQDAFEVYPTADWALGMLGIHC